MGSKCWPELEASALIDRGHQSATPSGLTVKTQLAERTSKCDNGLQMPLMIEWDIPSYIQNY